MKKKFGTIDGYLVADVMALVTVIMFIVFVSRKTNGMLWGTPAFITISMLVYQMMAGKAVIKNDSDVSVVCKDESGSGIKVCQPSEKICGIDGVKVGNIVYKVPDGVHAVVTDNHSVKIRSMLGSLMYKVRGGVMQTPPDKEWEPLFNA